MYLVFLTWIKEKFFTCEIPKREHCAEDQIGCLNFIQKFHLNEADIALELIFWEVSPSNLLFSRNDNLDLLASFKQRLQIPIKLRTIVLQNVVDIVKYEESVLILKF